MNRIRAWIDKSQRNLLFAVFTLNTLICITALAIGGSVAGYSPLGWAVVFIPITTHLGITLLTNLGWKEKP